MSATIKLDCDGSAEVFDNVSSPVDACWVCLRSAANPSKVSGDSAGSSGVRSSADGANPTADNNVGANGASTGCGSDTGAGCSSDALVVDVVTSTTDTSLTAGAVDTGSDFGCTAALLSETGSRLLTSLSDRVLATDRFGFFGVAAEKSEPDFLSLTVVPVDFLLLLSLSVGSSSLASVSPESSFDPAPSPLDSADDAVASDEPVDAEPVVPDVDVVDAPDVDVSVEPVSGAAHATPGVVATATPTPRATAKPPTRPTYLA